MADIFRVCIGLSTSVSASDRGPVRGKLTVTNTALHSGKEGFGRAGGEVGGLSSYHAAPLARLIVAEIGLARVVCACSYRGVDHWCGWLVTFFGLQWESLGSQSPKEY